MNKKLGNVSVFIEFTVSSGLAVFFHWVLHYKEVGYTIFSVGLLLSLTTYLFREEIEKTRDELREMYQKSHEIIFAISSIQDPECQSKAHELMNGAKTTIRLLQQGYIPLEESEFYVEAARGVENAIGHVRCVDPLTGIWERASLINFYQTNLRAVERGVRVTRVFVVNRDVLAKRDILNFIMQQVRDGINCRIAFRDELPNAGDVNALFTSSSFDFAVYDDRTVTEVFGQAGKYFGRKTTQPVEVAKFLRFYDLIAHSSHAVTIEDEKISVAGELFQLDT